MDPPVEKRPLNEHLKNLFIEMSLDLKYREKGRIVISGFTEKDGNPSELINLLNDVLLLEISKVEGFYIIEQDKMHSMLEEKEIALMDLKDTTTVASVDCLIPGRGYLRHVDRHNQDNTNMFREHELRQDC